MEMNNDKLAKNNECISTNDTSGNNNSNIDSDSTTTTNSGNTCTRSTSKNIFLKFDSAKPRFDLIDPWFEEDMAKVLTMGAAKYAEDNWKLNTDIKRYLGALERHLNEIKKGEYIDDESLLQHTAHIACNAMFLHYMIRKELNVKRKRK